MQATLMVSLAAKTFDGDNSADEAASAPAACRNSRRLGSSMVISVGEEDDLD
jgi:hypothetical protein